jgi:hypothetical protein
VADAAGCARRLGREPAPILTEAYVLGCAGTSECPGGQECCFYLGESHCQAECQGGVQVELCDRNEDCSPGEECRNDTRNVLADRTARSVLGLRTCCDAQTKTNCVTPYGAEL